MAWKPPIRERTAHLTWLAVAAVFAAMLTRGTLPVLFLAAFVVIWLLGFSALAWLYRR